MGASSSSSWSHYVARRNYEWFYYCYSLLGLLPSKAIYVPCESSNHFVFCPVQYSHICYTLTRNNHLRVKSTTFTNCFWSSYPKGFLTNMPIEAVNWRWCCNTIVTGCACYIAIIVILLYTKNDSGRWCVTIWTRYSSVPLPVPLATYVLYLVELLCIF